VPVTWSQQLNLAQLRAVLASPRGPVVRDLLRRGFAVETQAKRNLSGIGGPKRIDTGRLRASIHTAVVFRNGAPAVTIGTNVIYARWVHDGTGIYGPRHQLIRPKRGEFLRFPATGVHRVYQPKKGKARRRSFIYTKEVKGMRPNPFLRNALPAARR
jgi:hypothetical protein